MVTTATELAALRTEWEGVVRMHERMKVLVLATFSGGAFTAPALSKVVYNLPLLLAFDVLNQVLCQLRDEGRFKCTGSHLGNLMDKAQNALPWTDWAALRQGVRRRNEVAHDGKLFESKECHQDISNIETQLVAWGIIATASIPVS